MRTASFGLLIVAASLGACAQTPTQLLKQYGYVEQVPPSRLHGPGNLVYKRGGSSDRVMLGYVCDPKYVNFPGNPDVSPSETINFGRTRTFDLGSAELTQLGLTTSAKYVDSVTLKFENTEVQEYSLESLARIRDSLGPKCRQILASQRAANNAYQVVAALKADVSYDIKYNVDVSAEAKRLVRWEINAKLGLKTDSSRGEIGKALFYGLHLEPVTSGTISIATTQ